MILFAFWLITKICQHKVRQSKLYNKNYEFPAGLGSQDYDYRDCSFKANCQIIFNQIPKMDAFEA